MQGNRQRTLNGGAADRGRGLWQAALGVIVLAAGLAAGARAAESERLTVTVGAMEVVDAPFAVQGFRVADQSVVRVETLDDRKLRIMGLKAGSTDVQVTGGGAAATIYSITVIENITAVLNAMKRDLDVVPEVDLAVNLGRITVKGEVSSIEHWELLQKVLALYKGQVVNLASFRPAPEVMLGLKNALEKSGLKVVMDQDAGEPGVVSLKFSGNNIFLNGAVYSQKEVQRIESLVDSQDWLTRKKEEGSTKVMAVVNLSIVPTLIEVDTVFVGVSEDEYRQFGVNIAKAGLVAIDTTSAAFQGELGGKQSSSLGGSYSVNSSLAGVLKFFGASGPGRFQTAGHMTFKNDAPEWKTYQSGGTLKVRTATSEAVGISDIDYGLIIKVKGGLRDSKTASMDLELELSYPVPVGSDYDLKRNRIETSVDCPMGQTLVLAGMRGLVEQSSNEGFPFLRSIPVVSWLFSEKVNSLQKSKVLIMISPQFAGAPREALPVSQDTISTETEAQKSNMQRQRPVRKFLFF